MLELFIALSAGLISFLSPCVLPLIPGYISYISGSSLNEILDSKKINILPILFFAFGFSIVFISFGATATFLGSLVLDYSYELRIIAGLSQEQSEALIEGTAQLARQAGVAPQQVLKDIAASTETIAEFTKGGAENIAEAAVQARDNLDPPYKKSVWRSGMVSPKADPRVEEPKSKGVRS